MYDSLLSLTSSQMKYEVSQDFFFMVGDNHIGSNDSRHWGPVPESHLIGKAILILWSWSPDIPLTDFWNKLRSIRWDRIGKIIE